MSSKLKVILIVIFRTVVALALLGLAGVMCYHLWFTFVYMLDADDAFRRIPDYKRIQAQAQADWERDGKRFKMIQSEVGIPDRKTDAALGIDDLPNIRKLLSTDSKNLSTDALRAFAARSRDDRNKAEKRWTDAYPKWDMPLAFLADPSDANPRKAQLKQWDQLRLAVDATTKEINTKKGIFREKRDGSNALPLQLEREQNKTVAARVSYYKEVVREMPLARPWIELRVYKESKKPRLKATIIRGNHKPDFDTSAEPDGRVIEVGRPDSHFACINLGSHHTARLGMHFTVYRINSRTAMKEVVGEVEITKLGAQTSECLLLPPSYRKPVCPQCGFVAPDQKMFNCPYCTQGGKPGVAQKLDRDIHEVLVIPHLNSWELVKPGDYLYNPLFMKKHIRLCYYIAEDTVTHTRQEIDSYIRENGDRVILLDEPSYLTQKGLPNPALFPNGQLDLDQPGQPDLEVDYIVLGHGRQSDVLRTTIAPFKGLKVIGEEELYAYYGRPTVP